MALRQLCSWVLDRPLMPALLGQCCDRLRPAPVAQKLLLVLQDSATEPMALVDWRWDQRLGRVDGLLWQGGCLRRFRWWPARDQLVLTTQLRCSADQALRSLV